MPIARGLAALLVATGRFDAAARLLGNPFVFMLVRPGDGRWLEILKPAIDRSSRFHRLRLRFLFALVRRRSAIAEAMWRRTGIGSVKPSEFAALATEPKLPATALPYVLETAARQLPASRLPASTSETTP